MEDFKSYIWIIGLIITFLVSVFKKVKTVPSGREKEKEKEKGFFKEMLSQIDELVNEQKREGRAPAIEESVAEMPAMASTKAEPMKAKKYVRTVCKSDLKSTIASSRGRLIKPSKSADKTAITEVESDILADFDLRKAVLYSEIMNPKFNE